MLERFSRTSCKQLFNFSEIANLQKRVKDSLYRAWKECMSHDWMSADNAKTFPLKQFYVGLRWTKIVKRVLKNYKRDMKNVYEILTVAECGLNAINILATGNIGGMFSSVSSNLFLTSKQPLNMG